jgi:hypothetical protein
MQRVHHDVPSRILWWTLHLQMPHLLDTVMRPEAEQVATGDNIFELAVVEHAHSRMACAKKRVRLVGQQFGFEQRERRPLQGSLPGSTSLAYVLPPPI